MFENNERLHSDEAPQQPNKNEESKGGILDKIQQLGQTNVAQLPQDSNIHCLTIVGQIEGHMQLPPQNKTTKYEHVIPQIVATNKIQKLKDCLLS